MSRIRGVLPLFLATTIGIANGLWVFGPAFREQQLEKEGVARQDLDVKVDADNAELEALRKAEAEASRTAATNTALAAKKPQSWWSTMGLWANGSGPSKSEIPQSQEPPAVTTDEEPAESRRAT